MNNSSNHLHSMQSNKQNDAWQRGDKCLAPWSGDNFQYKATIKELRKCDGNSMVAVVKYDGYTDDEEEEVDINDISKLTPDDIISSSQKSDDFLFKPLKGNEEEIRIQNEYSSWELNEDLAASGYQPSCTTGRRMSEMSVVIEGETWKNCKKGERNKQNKNFKKSPYKNKSKKTLVDTSELQLSFSEKGCQEDPAQQSALSEKISYRLPEPTSSMAKAATSGFNDFGEIFVEKPQFDFSAFGKKVPFTLSKPGAVPPYQVPANINQHLRDYQREGIQFLFKHYQNNKGAILGDDMGLGKTVQVIGFIAALLGKTGTKVDVWRLEPAFIRELSSVEDDVDPSLEQRPFLVIGPGCVLYNWLDELETWGYFSVGKFHGSDKQKCLDDLDRKKLEVVVTTFETFRDNKEYLNKMNWAAVIVDEVHRIKGLKTRTSQALRSIVCKNRYGLTGTALQNNMTELWCILDWARPGYLGSASDFEEKFMLPIELGQKHNATKRQLANARRCKQKFSEIRSKIMIRRTKTLISDQLPKKDDNVVFCKLTDFQRNVYEIILKHPDLRNAIHAGDPCFCGGRRKRGKCCGRKSSTGKPVKSVVFQYMHLLLKVSNHVALLATDNKADSSRKNQATMNICKEVFQNYPHFLTLTQKATSSALSDPKYCCKMKVLVELLAVFYEKHSKILLFSYSTRLLDILETYMRSKLYNYRRIDGKTSSRQRLNIVREFNKNPNIFVCLISTKAGGLGLNMTGANVVIIFDPNWNPSHDLQAQDRAYRIGQQRHVQVFRLISAGTIEENIYLRQVYKQQLDKIAVNTENAKRYFHGIQGDRQQKGELFGMKNMFQLRTGDTCLSRDILERNEKIEKQLAGHQVTKYVPSSQEEAQENEDDNIENTNDSDSEDNSDESKDKSSDEEEEDPYADWFSSLSDDMLITSGSSDEDDNNQESEEKNKQKNKTTNKKGDSRISLPKDQNTDAPHPTTSHQSVPSFTDMFERCGVVHVHENHKVTGGSRAEDHMTKCALQEVLQENKNSQQLAIDCEPYELSDSEEDGRKKRKRKSKKLVDHNTPQKMSLNHYQVLYGQTPEGMLRKHLIKMATSLGFTSVHTFCQKVIDVSATERLQMLQQFYVSEHGPWLTTLFQSLPKPTTAEQTNIDSDEEPVSSKRKKSAQKIKSRPSKHLSYVDSKTELEIGKSTKKSQLQTPPKTRIRTKMKPNPSSSKKNPSKVHFAIEEHHPPSTSRVDDGDSENKDQENPTNIDTLLDEMALSVPMKTKIPQHNPTNLSLSNKDQLNIFSEVDRIFLESGARKGEVRKPPPKKRTKPTNLDNDSTSLDTTSRHGQDDTEKVPVISDSVDFLDDLLRNSTLKESADDNSFWKRHSSRSKYRSRQKFSDHVSQILEDDEKKYKSMFASGKMIRINKSSAKEDGDKDEDEEDEDDGSQSLF